MLVASAVGYTAVRESPTAAAASDAPVREPTVPAGVPGFAEMYVAAYLTGTAESINEFLPAAPSVTAMTPAARYVTRTATAELTHVADDYWRVVVAADVLVLENGTYSAAGLQYFQVGVIDDGGRLVAAALPARVAGPAPRPTPPRSLQIADATPTGEQASLAGDFLEALLTDRRDIERYVAPGSAIAAISPAPYEAISITALGLYGDGSALVTVDAQSAGGMIDSMQYVLRFSDEGRNESVAAMLAGPPSIARTEPQSR